jgi:hypothetical protein
MEMGYIYAAATILSGFLLALIANFIVRWLKSKAGKTETHWDDIIISAIGKPVQVAIIAISIYIALKYYGIVPAQYSGSWTTGSSTHSIFLLAHG